MRFNYVTLSVKDMDASIRFYEEIVGLPLKRRFPSRPGTEIAFLGEGETEVELISGREEGQTPNDCVFLGFEAESLEDTINLLRQKGYETDGNIISPAPDFSFFFARDPDGYKIQFGVH